jgi:1-phosphofructokinase family hexose kinase
VIAALALSASVDVTYVVDSLTVGEIHRPDTTLKLAGGKALNVARALVALGEPVRAIAVLGGSAGAFVERLLADEGVDTRVLWSDVETRNCVTIASTESGKLTEVYERPTPVGVLAQAEVERELDDLSGDVSWLALSGSIPSDVDLTSLGSALTRCRERGIHVALDTHGEALAALIDLVHPELVKVNRAEAAELLLAPTGDTATLAAGIRSRSSGLVVVTDGANGSLAFGEQGVAVSPPVDLVGRYPVGSGDCFLAGFLVATVRGLTFERALAVAASCAAANAAVPGAAIFDRTETLEALVR